MTKLEKYTDLLEQGRQSEEAGKVDEAIRCYTEAADLIPNEVQAWSHLFALYFFYLPEKREDLLKYAEKCIKLDPSEALTLEMLATYFLDSEEEGEALWALLTLYKMKKRSHWHLELNQLSKLVELLQQNAMPINPTHLGGTLPKLSLKVAQAELAELQKREEEIEVQDKLLEKCLRTFGTKKCPKCGQEWSLQTSICSTKDCYEDLPIPADTIVYDLKRYVKQGERVLLAVYLREFHNDDYSKKRFIERSPRSTYFYENSLFYLETGEIKWQKNLDASIINFTFTPDNKHVILVTSFQRDELAMYPLEDLVVYRRKHSCSMCGKLIPKDTPCWRGNVLLSTAKDQIQLMRGPADHPDRVARVCLECRPVDKNKPAPPVFHLYYLDLTGQILANIPIQRPDVVGTSEPYFFGSGDETLSMRLVIYLGTSDFRIEDNLTIDSIADQVVTLNLYDWVYDERTKKSNHRVEAQIEVDLSKKEVEFKYCAGNSRRNQK